MARAGRPGGGDRTADELREAGFDARELLGAGNALMHVPALTCGLWNCSDVGRV